VVSQSDLGPHERVCAAVAAARPLRGAAELLLSLGSQVLARALRRQERIARAFLEHLCLPVLEGEGLVELGQARAVELLDQARHRRVQPPPLALEQRRIGDVVGEGVLEHVGELGVDALLVDQLEPPQLVQQLGRFLRLGHALEEAHRELTPDHRSDLQRAFRPFVEAVDAGEEHLLDRGGDLLPDSLVCILPIQQPAFVQGFDDLLDEEGVAVRALCDDPLEFARNPVAGKHRAGQLVDELLPKTAQLHSGEIAALAVRPTVLGTMGGDDEHARPGQGVEESAQQLLAAGVDPVHILEEQDHWLLLREGVHQIANGFEEVARLEQLLHARQALVTRVDAQQIAVEGLTVLHGSAQTRAAFFHLLDNALGGVRLVDFEVAAQQVRDRVMRDAGAVAHALALEPVGVDGELAPKLVDEARLADACLAGQEDHLPRSAPGFLQAFAEQRELGAAPDVARQAGAQHLVPALAARDRTHQAEDRRRLALALEGLGGDLLGLELLGDELARRLGEVDLVGRSECLDARRHVRGVADG
jgi:hypothetical protein